MIPTSTLIEMGRRPPRRRPWQATEAILELFESLDRRADSTIEALLHIERPNFARGMP